MKYWNQKEVNGDIHKYFAIAGNFLLMMFYTTVGGWMLAYFFKMLKGEFVGADSEKITNIFGTLTSNRNEMIFWMIIISLLGLAVCSLGLEKGVEKITKAMMVSLFFIMLVLVVRALTLPNAMEGLEFYLKPDLSKIKEAGIGTTVFAAMGQSFFNVEYRNRRIGNIWKLYWKRESADRRGDQS